MARPAAKRLLYAYDRKFVMTEVLQAKGVYAVFYNGSPINRVVTSTSPPDFRYCWTSFAEPGSAARLARNLNEKFNSDKFTAVEMTSAKLVKPKPRRKRRY